MTEHTTEMAAGLRFAFGSNWARFLLVLNEDRIHLAEQSLLDMLGFDDLKDKRFLDIGSGSGLFSLAARRLGATVHSFDYDPQSVACTQELKHRYFPDDTAWVVDEASVLDREYLSRLGQFDVVYSWGVLHHTGAMWQALENVSSLVKNSGQLFIAIYNDQGSWSRRWKIIKYVYNTLPDPLKLPYVALVMGPRELKFLILASMKGKPWIYFDNAIHYSERSLRGMSYWHDLIDWVGGYPFEVAKPEDIFDVYHAKGFSLQRLKSCAGGLACNEFVFTRI